MNYVRPEVLMDFGPSKRYWVDGKTSLLAGDAAQYRKFFDYTSSAEGRIAIPSGLYGVHHDPVTRKIIVGGDDNDY